MYEFKKIYQEKRKARKVPRRSQEVQNKLHKQKFALVENYKGAKEKEYKIKRKNAK